MTGVDRVEFAYLRALVADPVPLFALARTRLGYVLLSQDGAEEILRRARQDGWGRLDALGLVTKGPAMRRRAEADLRREALGRALPWGLAALLRRHLPEGTTYYNTGHSNLTERVVDAWRSLPGARIEVLVHDTIPLDVPQYQRPETLRKFKHFLGRTAQVADRVICNSQATLDDCQRHMQVFGRIPAGLAAPLGIETVRPGPCPDDLPPGPFFVSVGTIEPRKNHALLLDIWDQFAAEGRNGPHLLLCGARGWANAAVLARLDAGNPLVQERPGLSDAEIAALLVRSRGLLFPSLAEGYGLPPIEAAALGVPVLLADLPVYRETLEDIPIYLPPQDAYSWRQKIEQLQEQRPPTPPYLPPSWDTHFNLVLTEG
ncbi:glycosyltransferase family 1 protein [Marinovum sp.]|uniref:glycosyltransferase family 4 protein n=1 Tax=Marinovum sp. TaxID=2024839 RepID=UPI002B2751BB|nr:glycosyltransferase family 1 protein [Marinovum sp.]